MGPLEPDGFYLYNIGLEPLRFIGYDAGKVLIPEDVPVIPNQHGRFLSTNHIGDTDFIVMLVFYATETFSPPPGIGIHQGVHGGGGGITIAGWGGSASVTVTEAYDQPAAALKMTLFQFPTSPDSPPGYLTLR